MSQGRSADFDAIFGNAAHRAILSLTSQREQCRGVLSGRAPGRGVAAVL
jgi:hypothetical protein